MSIGLLRDWPSYLRHWAVSYQIDFQKTNMNQQIKEWGDEVLREFKGKFKVSIMAGGFYNPIEKSINVNRVADYIEDNFHPKSTSIDKEVLRNWTARRLTEINDSVWGQGYKQALQDLKESLGL